MRSTDTKTLILIEALRLFSVSGYEAVTVEQISAAVGIKAPSLYKHYKSKRDIFDHIVLRMQEGDADKAGEHRMPDSNERAAAELTPLERIRQYSVAMFRYWTEDEFPSCFRRMLTLEQYRSAEMSALEFYAPMHLLYSMYDGAAEKCAVLPLLEDYIDGFCSRFSAP